MSGNIPSGIRKPGLGLFLLGALVALLLCTGAPAQPPAVPGPVAPGAGGYGPVTAEQVLRSGVFILGPVTMLLLLEN